MNVVYMPLVAGPRDLLPPETSPLSILGAAVAAASSPWSHDD